MYLDTKEVITAARLGLGNADMAIYADAVQTNTIFTSNLVSSLVRLHTARESRCRSLFTRGTSLENVPLNVNILFSPLI